MERESLLTMLINHLLGRRYYANIVVTAGTFHYDLCSHIFRTKEEAENHKKVLETTKAYIYVETITFRSKNENYKDYIKR